MKVKKKKLEGCTLPVLNYGSQTWATTEAQILKLSRTQLAMGWSLAGIKRRDKIRNTLGFKPIPECATLDSRVSDQGRICDFIY